MKQIILNLDDSAFEPFMGIISLCSKIEVVYNGIAKDTRDVVDCCFSAAVKDLVERKALRYAYDYTYIMIGVNEGLVDKQLFFISPQEYLDYLNELGGCHLPGKSTLYNTIGRTCGKYPDWEFTDSPTTFEALRRKNVFKQFLSAYSKSKRLMLERMLENKQHVGMDIGK